MSYDRFISDLKDQCKKHDVKLKLTKGKSLKINNNHVGGYFDTQTLACAMGKQDSILTLIHESCHLDQYIKNITLWNELDGFEDIDEWLCGKDVKNINEILDKTKWLELDCEKRSVNKLLKYKIPFNKELYIQKANSYVHFYNYMKVSRKWCHKSNTPYNNPGVYKFMPKAFMPKKWYDKLDDRILSLYIQNNI